MADDNNVVRLPVLYRPPEDGGVVGIVQDAEIPGTFEVRVWWGLPGDPGVATMYCGPRPSFAEAAQLAREKATQLPGFQVVDLTNLPEDGPGGVA